MNLQMNNESALLFRSCLIVGREWKLRQVRMTIMLRIRNRAEEIVLREMIYEEDAV